MKVKRSRYMYAKKSPLKIAAGVLLAVAVLFGLGWFVAGPLMSWINSPVSTVQSSLPTSAEASSGASGAASAASQPAVSSETEAPAGVNSAIRAVCPSGADLHDDAALTAFCESAAAAGANTVIIDVKDTEGYILYTDIGYDYTASAPDSAYAAVAAGGTDPAYTARANLSGVTQIIKAQGMNAVARINCFMDCRSGSLLKGAKLTLDSGGTTWLDDSKSSGGKCWLNPYSTVVSDFTLTICGDCADFGFDAVALDFVQFPVGFSTSRINYGDEAAGIDKKTCLENFINKMTGCGLPVFLTVRNLTESGSAEFAGSPFAYECDIAGYLAIVNAPVSARRLSPTAVTEAVAQGSYPTDKRVIMAALTDGGTSTLDGLGEYAQLAY